MIFGRDKKKIQSMVSLSSSSSSSACFIGWVHVRNSSPIVVILFSMGITLLVLLQQQHLTLYNTSVLYPSNAVQSYSGNNATTSAAVPAPTDTSTSTNSSSSFDNRENLQKMKMKKVKVFLLMGQSNMVGFGKVTNEAKYKYPFFATTSSGNERGNKNNDNIKPKLMWKRLLHNEDNINNSSSNSYLRRRVRYVSTSGSGGPKSSETKIGNNKWLTMKNQNYIGVEIGIGYQLGKMVTTLADTGTDTDNDYDILLLKTCTLNVTNGFVLFVLLFQLRTIPVDTVYKKTTRNSPL